MGSKRRMPIEEEWFDKKTNDILYGWMQAAATYDKEIEEKDKQLYYPKAQFTKDLKTIKTLLRIKDKRSVMSKVKALIDSGYVGEDTNNYYFPYNPNNPYILVDKELLFNIVTTTNEFGLKIYTYLLNKQGYKQRYHFTINELKQVFGYSATTKGNIETIIAGNLDSLLCNDIIAYHVEQVEIPTAHGIVKTRNFVLDNVAIKLPERKKFRIQEMETMAEEGNALADWTTQEERKEAEFNF